jgi:hypothetical protein
VDGIVMLRDNFRRCRLDDDYAATPLASRRVLPIFADGVDLGQLVSGGRLSLENNLDNLKVLV